MALMQSGGTSGPASLLGYDDIPWPNNDTGENPSLVPFGTSGFVSLDCKRSALLHARELWDPDHFERQFGRYLVHDERDRIMAEVRAISLGLETLSLSLSRTGAVDGAEAHGAKAK